MAYRSSTSLALGTAADAIISVPASVAADDIVVVPIYIENNTKTITPPAGFALKYGPDSIAAEHHTYWFWKRLTGADSGSYTFSWTGAEPRQAAAIAFSGRITTGDPFDESSWLPALATTDFPYLFVSAEPLADAMVMFSTWSSSTLTGPTGFTERVESSEIAVATLDSVPGGVVEAKNAVWGFPTDLIARLATLKSSTRPPIFEHDNLNTLRLDPTRY